MKKGQMKNKRQLGREYEQQAAAFLIGQDFEIIEYNYRNRQGEIDIIAREGEYLCFVEVKYRSTDKSGYAAEAVTWKKQQIISRVADYYIRTHCRKIPSCRFDVVALDGEKVMVYENAFEYVPRGY